MDNNAPPHTDIRSADVAVIGGGLAGLTAAAMAARRGASTVLLEAHSLGGRARSVEQHGVLLNEGPHALYTAGSGASVLASLGIDLPGHAPLSPARLRVGEALHAAPFTAAGLASTSLLGVRDRLAFATAYAKVLRSGADADLDMRAFGSWLAEEVRSPAVRAILETVARVSTYCAEPDAMPAGTMLRQLRAAAKGVRYLDGGWQALVDALARAARVAGVTVLEHAAVESVSRRADVWSVTLPGGGIDAASVVIASGGPGLAGRLLGCDVGADRAGEPVHAAVLDLVLDRLPPDPVVFGVDAPLYLSAHCPPARLGEGVLVSAMRYLGTDERLPADDLRAELRAHFDLANRGSGAARVLAERYLHRLVVAHGRPSVEHGGLRGRPPVAIEGVAGAFVAGDWVGQDGLLADASLMSGRAAGELAADHVRERQAA